MFHQKILSVDPPCAAAIPVNPEPSPLKLVAANAPVLELKVKLVPVLGARSPVASVK